MESEKATRIKEILREYPDISLRKVQYFCQDMNYNTIKRIYYKLRKTRENPVN